ncbi:MAG: SDR family oxidoreductase [Actinomycetia bacterium]|nr:SDR family oxidoreductase [Actinomycetes bacterium]
MDLGLQDRVALVTGAGQGIGRAIAETLGREGARVAIHYHTSSAGAEAARATIVAQGGRAATFGGDLRRPGFAAELVRAVEDALGPVDVLVNNAAAVLIKPFLESTPEEWRDAFEVTLFAGMALTHAVLPKMVERRRGSIIMMAGDAGRTGESRLAATAASRAAAMAFAKSIAREFGRYGVRANVVSLGVVEKDGESHVPPSQLERVLRLYPLGRLGRVDDVPPLVALLASDRTGWVTGQVFSVNGGYVMP